MTQGACTREDQSGCFSLYPSTVTVVPGTHTVETCAAQGCTAGFMVVLAMTPGGPAPFQSIAIGLSFSTGQKTVISAVNTAASTTTAQSPAFLLPYGTTHVTVQIDPTNQLPMYHNGQMTSTYDLTIQPPATPSPKPYPTLFPRPHPSIRPGTMQ